MEQALYLAADQINAKGGVNGKQLEVVAADGTSEDAVFAERAEQLIAEDCVAAVFGGWTSASREAMIPVFEKHNALLYYPKTYEGYGKSKNVFYMGATANQQTIPALEFLKAQGKKKIFLVGSDYIGPRMANKVAKAWAAQAGVEIVGEEYTPIGNVSYTDISAKIRASEADAVYNTLAGDSNVAFFKQLTYDGVSPETTPVMSWAISENELDETGAPYMAGDYTATTYLESLDNPANKAFVEEFRKKYGENESTADTLQVAYSSLFLWKAAVEKADSFAVDDVRAASDGVGFESPEGLISIDGATQHLVSQSVIGKITSHGTIEPAWVSPEAIKPDPFLKQYPWAADITFG